MTYQIPADAPVSQSDNDFMTTHGISLGEKYNAGLDNDNQFLVFRVTLPTR